MPIGSRALKRAIEQADDPRRHRGGKSDFLQYVDVYDFLKTLDIEIYKDKKTTADEYNFTCPFPGHTSGDARPSGYMNDGSKDPSKTTVWKCHGCSRSGNAISFYAEVDGVSKQEAALHIRQTWAPNFRAPKGGSIANEIADKLADGREQRNAVPVPMKTIAWEHYDEMFRVNWFSAYKMYDAPDCPPEVAYLFDRGFRPQPLSRWRIGYDPLSERITIPVSNADGSLVGVKGRLPHDDRKPKYIAIGDRENKRPRYKFMPYEKSRVIFGLDRVRKSGRKVLVLVEGELDVIALWMLGIPAISTGSAHLSDEQAILLRDYADEIIVFFDTNTAGEQATWGYEDKDGDWHPGVVEKLEPFMRLRIVEDHEHDASKLVQLGRGDEARRLVADARSHVKLYLA